MDIKLGQKSSLTLKRVRETKKEIEMSDDKKLEVPDLSKFENFVIGEKLFSSGDDWRLNAKIAANDKDWRKYASAYELAVETLCERILTNPSGIDLLIYPIGFLFRHYIELSLKEIILTGSYLLERDCGEGLGHSLEIRWTAVRKILEEVWPDGDNTDLDGLEACIKEYMEIDPNSQSFRYPADTKGNPTLEKVKTINIGEFVRVTKKITILLNGASIGLSVYLSDKMDYESEMKRQMGEYYNE